MINKKSLYEVKLILDYLPKEEYKKIPESIIEFIEEYFEYDENIKIDPSKDLNEQNLDEGTFQMLEKIMKITKR